MFKMFVFLSLFNLSAFDFGPATETASSECPGVTNLQKTGQTSNSIAYSWSSAYNGAQYAVWYVRREDGYSSGLFYTSSTSYNFAGLSPGHYTFYFQTQCGEEMSGFIGIEDTISA